MNRILLLLLATLGRRVNSQTEGANYVLLGGNCGSADTPCDDTECGMATNQCDMTCVMDYIKEIAISPAVYPSKGLISGLGPQYIGETNKTFWKHLPEDDLRCDHTSGYWTALWQEPFSHDGDLEYVEWVVAPDCGDAFYDTFNTQTPNAGFRIAIMEKVTSPGDCTGFRVWKWIEIPREKITAYDQGLRAGTEFGIRYYFTNDDLINLGAPNIMNKYLAVQWLFGGWALYIPPQDTQVRICLADSVGDWLAYAPNEVIDMSTEKEKRTFRQYAWHVRWQPL